MFDENAFGVLLSYFDIEDDEYALEPQEFATRWKEFHSAWREALDIFRLGDGVRGVDLGHALYLEVGDGDQAEDPIVWLKMVRARLLEKGFSTFGAVTHGGRWLEEGEAEVTETLSSGIRLVGASLPSEPFRRALYADTASRIDEEHSPDGWGSGLFVDTDALEALSRTPKNAPTPLAVAGATFYRVAR
jgi:hypothetical protein